MDKRNHMGKATDEVIIPVAPIISEMSDTYLSFIDNIKNDDNQQDVNKEDEELENKQLPFTRKYKLEQIEHELKHVIHDGFDYSLYSELDKSNDRFMLKQANTNMIKGSLFDKSKSQSDISYMELKKNENSQPTLFGEELPF